MNVNNRSFSTEEIYHIYNRGVDKRIIYTTDEEYRYFIHLLFILNLHIKANNTKRNFKDGKGSTSTINTGGAVEEKVGQKERYVDILSFCLMPNHFHLLLRPLSENGISKFMQKLGTGYTMYFNKKNSRSGSLFQGRYKSVHIETDQQLLYIPHYVHLNPLPLKPSNSELSELEYLTNYKWSSLQDYAGIKNFPSLLNKSTIIDLFEGRDNYISDFKTFLSGNQEPHTNLIDNSVLIDF